jgi:hypothetical protein
MKTPSLPRYSLECGLSKLPIFVLVASALVFLVEVQTVFSQLGEILRLNIV